MAVKPTKLVIFDHSGVLSDDRQPVYEANMILLERYGHERISFEDWLEASKASVGELVHNFGIDVVKEVIDAEYQRVYNNIVTRETDPIRPTMYDDVPDVLQALAERRIPRAIISSHPYENLLRELREYGISGFFNEVSGNPSPKVGRLKDMCEQFGVSPKQTVFVEDTIYGLRHGKEAGVRCIGVTTGYHSRKRLEAEGTAIAVVDSLTEILDHILV
jgi:phosphoglycolate phosphatase